MIQNLFLQADLAQTAKDVFKIIWDEETKYQVSSLF